MTDDQIFEINRQVFDSNAVKVTTIGPTAPPANFVAQDFLAYIIDLKQQSEGLGWVSDPAVSAGLQEQLVAVQTHLGGGQIASALTDLDEFLSAVENHNHVALTSEGYGLLKFNALYLRDQLVQQIPSDVLAPVTTVVMTPLPNAAGWHNSDVTVTLNAADEAGGSGVKEIRYTINSDPEVVVSGFTAEFPVSTEGENLIRYHAVDQAGNAELEKTLLLKIDLTPPVITAALSPHANAAGWHNSDVTVTFAAVDTSSGGVVCTETSPLITSEGKEQPVSTTCTDLAGNQAVLTVQISLDKTAPEVVFGSGVPAANAAGWNRSDVSVPFTVSDPLSGVAVTSVSSPLKLVNEGENVSEQVSVSDRAGNSATFTSPAYKIDKTPPAVAFGAVTPGPNSAGWNNTDVSVDFTVSDALSGILNTSPATSPLLFNTDGTGLTQSVVATDVAGNRAIVDSPSVNRDTVTPTLTFEAGSPAPNPAGWHKTDVTVPFTVSDDRSGVAGTTPSGPLILSTEGMQVTGEVTVSDLAGNNAVFTSPAFKIDQTPPTLTLPVIDPVYLLNATLSLTFGANDSLSSVATVSATLNGTAVTSGSSVTLTEVGDHTFVLTASDQAGNNASESIGFNVQYQFGGFLPPITADGRTIFRFGSVIPVKFQLSDANGVSIGTAVARLVLQQFSGVEPVGDPVDAVSVSAADTGNLFRHDGGQYIYNLDTGILSAGTWELRAVLDDGSVRAIQIGLKSK